MVDTKRFGAVFSGGENVYPSQVETVLDLHPDLEDFAGVGVEDPDWGQVLKAFVVKKKGRDVTSEDLERFLKEKLAGYQVPKSIAFVDSIPRNHLGKLQAMTKAKHLLLS